MADEHTTDPQGQGPEGAGRSASAGGAEGSATDGGSTDRSEQRSVAQPRSASEGPSAAADAERALKAAQDAIHGLEAQASAPEESGGSHPAASKPSGGVGAESADDAGEPEVAAGLGGAAQARDSGQGAGEAGRPSADGKPVDLPRFETRADEGAPARSLDLLSDVNLNVRIELGRTRMLVEDVLRLGEGAVVELDKLAGDPVDVFVNGRPVARGEVLVLNDSFCIRISEILDEAKERVQREAAG